MTTDELYTSRIRRQTAVQAAGTPESDARAADSQPIFLVRQETTAGGLAEGY
jgi:hypothetical protein